MLQDKRYCVGTITSETKLMMNCEKGLEVGGDNVTEGLVCQLKGKLVHKTSSSSSWFTAFLGRFVHVREFRHSARYPGFSFILL